MTKYIALVDRGFDTRDVWRVDALDMRDAMEQIGVMIGPTGSDPESIIVLPESGKRCQPFIFPDDPRTDDELALDYLRGFIRPVRLTEEQIIGLTDDGGYQSTRYLEGRKYIENDCLFRSMTDEYASMLAEAEE